MNRMPAYEQVAIPLARSLGATVVEDEGGIHVSLRGATKNATYQNWKDIVTYFLGVKDGVAISERQKRK